MTQDNQQTQTPQQPSSEELVGGMEQKGPVEALDEVMEEAGLLTDPEQVAVIDMFAGIRDVEDGVMSKYIAQEDN
jgi:hypothetical protein